MPFPSNTRTFDIKVPIPEVNLKNPHRPSLGAVHRYQVVPAVDPNHSPRSSVAPRVVP